MREYKAEDSVGWGYARHFLDSRATEEATQAVRKRLMRDRKRYPEVRGKFVDYIRHSVDDGMLYVTVSFKHKTAFPLRYACEMFAVEVDLSDWKTGNMEMIRKYMEPIPR